MCRVLILDDDRYYSETLKLILEDENEAHPDVAATAEEAFEQVRHALRKNKPYEILMIDYRLGPDKDGIEVFKELRAISSESDGIILTGFDDNESGMRAYQAGAFRYLPKTATNDEMLFVFRALRQWRKEQRENTWQKIFSEVMEDSIREKTFQDVAKVIVRRSLKLGFTRAHLFWVPTGAESNQQDQLLGIACAGEQHIPKFGDRRLYPLNEWVDTSLLKKVRNAIFIRSEELDYARTSLEQAGYLPPLDEIVVLPLWSANRLLGALLLDHGQMNKTLNDHERSLLNFYARQVSLALEHAVLYTRQEKMTKEQAEISRIGQGITAGATDKTPEQILAEVRAHMSAYIDTSNFTAFLVDEDTYELDYRLCYRNNQAYECPRITMGSGLESYLLTQQGKLFITNVPEFIERNNIHPIGDLPSCWLGIPLRVSDKTIGGITIHTFAPQNPFTEWDVLHTSLLAEQVSGAVQNCHAAEKEHRDTEKLNVLSRAGVEMLQMARENEENLWKMALTIATANFGVGFNRAMLFLKTEPSMLLGRAAIGTTDSGKAHQDWQIDAARHYDFDEFLCDLKDRNVKPTDFDSLVAQIEIPLDDRKDAFTWVLQTGQPLELNADEAYSELPPEISAQIDIAACAVLPLSAGRQVHGIVLVDNKHNRRPIASRELNRLQTVLNYAGLIWETLQEHEQSENLLYSNLQIMSASGREDLKYTLARICNAALGLTQADWNIIYPFKEHSEGIVFDRDNTAYAGELKSSGVEGVLDKEKPSANGTTAYLQKHGELIVPDVAHEETKIGHKRIANHKFIKDEDVKAIIGINIQDAYTDHPLGVLYLNYREPRQFSELDIRHAKSFASLAAFAIANSRRMNEQKLRLRLEAALQTAEAVGSSPEQEEMLKNVLARLHDVFFQETTLCVLTYDDAENSLKFAPGALAFYKITNPACRQLRNFPLEGQSIACTVARRALKTGNWEKENVPDVFERTEYLKMITQTRSELCVSLMSGEKKLLGILALERTLQNGFDQDDEALVEVVAQQLSMGLERFRQREQVSFNKTVSALTTWAADLAHEINNEAGNIQSWAYLIKEFAEDSLTISDYASQIEDSARRLSTAGSWSDQGRLPIPLDYSLKKYAETLTNQYNIHSQLYPGATGAYINANPAQFQRVLRHLIRNASRAMKEKKHKKIILRTHLLEAESMVEILIQDFGQGVAEKVRPLLFQTNVTTKNRGGYGLLITRQLIEEMGGSIRLLPKEPGKGAVFSIKLPVFQTAETGAV